jgi:hypothetical protein
VFVSFTAFDGCATAVSVSSCQAKTTIESFTHGENPTKGEEAIEPMPCIRSRILSRLPSRAQLEAHEWSPV